MSHVIAVTIDVQVGSDGGPDYQVYSAVMMPTLATCRIGSELSDFRKLELGRKPVTSRVTKFDSSDIEKYAWEMKRVEALITALLSGNIKIRRE